MTKAAHNKCTAIFSAAVGILKQVNFEHKTASEHSFALEKEASIG